MLWKVLKPAPYWEKSGHSLQFISTEGQRLSGLPLTDRAPQQWKASWALALPYSEGPSVLPTFRLLQVQSAPQWGSTSTTTGQPLANHQVFSQKEGSLDSSAFMSCQVLPHQGALLLSSFQLETLSRVLPNGAAPGAQGQALRARSCPYFLFAFLFSFVFLFILFLLSFFLKRGRQTGNAGK